MPSHSKKQHRFMEAIAHSPSFAKKAGVPQSVGKDYAAADKGKTFSKGGEMKEAMVGKEVAFMKKKGAPKSMIKHEEAEMKRGGKVRRMAGGGMGAYDPFALSDEDVAKYEKNGAENLKRLKNFFMGRRSESEPSAPIDSSRDKPAFVSSSPMSQVSSDEGIRTPSGPQRRTGSTIMPSVVDQMARREEGGSNYGPDYGATYSDYGDNSGSSSQIFKPRRQPVTVSETKQTKSVTAAPSEGMRNPIGGSKKTITEATSDEGSRTPSGTQRKFGSAPRFGVATDEARASLRKLLNLDYNPRHPKKKEDEEASDKPYNPRHSNKAKGGPVKTMAMGGFTREADGVAKKGKTQGKVVKMASGGFVKNADGCAQRGKTKAFQVKMSRGGKC